MNRSSGGHPESPTRDSVSVVVHDYRIFRSDQSTARAEAKTPAAQRFDVEPDEVLVVDEYALEEEDEPLGWLVSLLVEHNASEGSRALD
jgi:hypothetical protein